jgi:chromosome segregation ATPase
MARPGVTYLDVANAAQQLVTAGRTPTIESIRITLGTGSNSTLGNHLRTWKSKQDQTQQIATKENIPEELIAALKGLWERVMHQSEEKIQTIHQETQQELITLKQEAQRLQKDNAYWQQRHQQTKQERDSFAQGKSVVEQLLTNSKIEIAALTEKYAGLEHQNKEKQERIDELRRQNQQIQTNLEHYRNASLEQRIVDQQRYEQQIKQLEQSIQQISQKSTKIQSEKSLLQKENQELIFERDNLKKQLDTLNEKHKSTNAHLTDALNELGRKTQDQQHWQEQLQTFQVKYDAHNKSFHEIQTQHAVLLQQIEMMKAEINELHEHNKLLAHEKWELGQEKAQLCGQLKQLESLVKIKNDK